MKEGLLFPGKSGEEYGLEGEKLRIQRRDNMISIELVYPERPAPMIHLDQESVRASDGIRMQFDYARDGWVIFKPNWRQNPDDPEWLEVIFVSSWLLEP